MKKGQFVTTFSSTQCELMRRLDRKPTDYNDTDILASRSKREQLFILLYFTDFNQ